MRRLQKVQKLDWLITILHPRLGRNAIQWRVQEARLETSTAQRLTVTAWAGDGRWPKMRRLRSVCLAPEQSPIHREQH